MNEDYSTRNHFKVRMLHPRYWLTWLALFVYYLLSLLLPLSVIDRIGMRLGDFAASKNQKRLNIVNKNLSLCFANKTRDEITQMASAHFRAQFRSLLHYYILWWRSDRVFRQHVRFEGEEQIALCQQQGKRVIILLSHTVGLDFAVTGLSMLFPAVGIYKPMRNEVIDWVIARARLRFSKLHDNKIFIREDGLRPLLKEMRSGKIFVYLADEDLGEKHSIFVPFFGVQKATLPLLGRLAKSGDAVVLPCASYYDESTRQYVVRVGEPLDGVPSGDDYEDGLCMNQAIEETIRWCPQQYLWTLRYFQTRPSGETSIYD